MKKYPKSNSQLRLRYWDCGENQNNVVIETDADGSQFEDFTFTAEDDAKETRA